VIHHATRWKTSKPPRDQISGVHTGGTTQPRGGTWVNVPVVASFPLR